MTGRAFWPPGDAAQADYEMLRAHVLEHDRLPGGLAAARFAHRGLAGLIAWPVAEPDFRAQLCGAARPPWTPHADPRGQALAAGYQFLLDAAVPLATPGATVMGDGLEGSDLRPGLHRAPSRTGHHRLAGRGTAGPCGRSRRRAGGRVPR